ETEVFDSPIRFEEIAQSVGVDFTYRNDEEAGQYAILESLGGGTCIFDYDGDGLQDLFVPGGGEFGENLTVEGLPGALFRQTGSLRYRDVTNLSGTGEAPHYSHGGHSADYDNDGFPDLLITGYGGVVLLHNRGDGTFQDVTAESGMSSDTLWSSSAAWMDLSGDGLLDVYLAHYVNWSFQNNPVCKLPPPANRDVCPPRDFQPLPDTVFFARGDGTFEDVSQKIGLRQDGKGLGVVSADLDLDGDLDVYVANDTVPNFLYRNTGDGILEDVSLMSGTSLNNEGAPDGSMGVDVVDYNLDGVPDLWCVNYENESLALYRNEGNCLFQHISQSTGIKSAAGLLVSWGTAFFDMDCDKDEDVFVSNGHVIRHPVNAPLRQLPLLLANDRGQRFVNINRGAGDYLSQPHMGRGLSAGDLDDDGNLDLIISHINEPVAILHNRTEHGRHWIGFRLIGRSSPRNAIGVRIEIREEGMTLSRQVKGGGSYASTHDLRVHFGLGESNRLDEVHIFWPSGIEQTLANLAIDRYHTIIEPPKAD
ncbi:MAG TPA: CRTAC1 family protein, partial [Planctomycetaceae bacterium]|nr:CRTAC1 family protein [Planctomycetaceae bacterium]